jgi:phosphoserine phosphatase RsbU/P
VNLSLAERRIEAQFVSLIYAVWDDQHRTLLVANSGLPRPIHVHAGKNHVSKPPACRWDFSTTRITTSSDSK